MDDPRSGTSATRVQSRGDVELSPSLSTSPILQGSSVSTPDRAVSELRGESRGRKKNENLPPSRAREVQRAFRARRAAHLAKLEDRILELENENTELRRLLLLPLPDRGVLGSGPTGRGKSLVEGGVPMSERVKAKRERDRKRAEAAAQARGETLPREKTPDDDTRSKGARAVSAGAVSKKRKLGDGHDEDRSGRQVSESFSATPSSSSMGLRSPSITLPTPISGTTGLPHHVHAKQAARLPSFSSTSGDVGASRPDSSSSYHHHLPIPPAIDTLGHAFGGMSGAQTPIPPLHSASMDSTSSGLVSAALGGRFPSDLHQPFTQQNQDQNTFMNFAAGMINNNQQMEASQTPNSSLLNSLLAALPGGNGLAGMNNNSGNHNDNFASNNSNNGNNGLPPLPELLSIILKNPELQRRVLQHQMAQKAQQNQMPPPPQHMQSFPSSNPPYPGPSSLFGFNAFDNKTNPQLDHISGYNNDQGDNAFNMARMDPSALFNDLFNNGRNMQDNGPNGGQGSNSSFMPNLMDTLGMSDQQFSTSLPLPGTDRPPSQAGNDNLLTFDRIFGSHNPGMSNPNLNNPDFLGPSTEQLARPTLPPPPMPLKNVFNASSAASSSIARPSSVPLPHRPQGSRSTASSRGTGTHTESHDIATSGSADLKGKGRDSTSHPSNTSTHDSHHLSARTAASAQSASNSKSQPDLLHRLRHCCHLSDVHVTSDPGLLLFASRLCLAVGCDYSGKHDGAETVTSPGDSAGQADAGNDEDYLKLEAAWQLLRQHLDPPSPESSSHLDLPDLTGSGDNGNKGGKPIDGQNQIATGRLAAEMVLRAVRAKTQSHDGEDRQQGGKDMSRWIACRRNPGMSVDRAMVVALVNGFGSN
ncbi:hypothetical protein QFC22_000267 [Naganishia vaughanmartiniae]|uniref:Uncharacterized protein n=1 Tax=Naganishia vaughanmartiniae TaxID=1424756 RepID=A0ACC2XPN2_9TREE|nr:hypothetical protein QFC22_000267 [Naganishia vaughanmartiniae]